MTGVQITDYDIQALVDGEADISLQAQILEALAKDPSLYNRYMMYQKQKKLLKSWWKDH